MPTPASEAARRTHPRPSARAITRREGLLAAVLLVPAGLLAACSDDAAPAGDTASSSAGTAAGSASSASVAAEVAADEAALISLYDAAIATLPAGDDRLALLTGIRDQHAAHLDAVGGTAGSVATDPLASGPLPTTPDAMLATLSRAERQASRSRIRAGEDADGDLARLLVFLAASESAHAAELRRARG